MATGYLLLLAATAAAWQTTNDGWIGGVVVNQSQHQSAVAGATVVLEMKTDGDFVLLDRTTTDEHGRYLFGNLLVSPHVTYKSSAHHQGIHYPGPRLVLTDEQKTAAATLAVRDVVTTPNPLRVTDHQIQIQPSAGVLTVTETLVIDNPTRCTYVGVAAKPDTRNRTWKRTRRNRSRCNCRSPATSRR